MFTPKLLKQWLLLITARIVLSLFSQRSYIHPDEFFQGVEIISGDLFNCSDKIYRAWEFELKNDQEPIRNIVIPYLFYGIPLYILKVLSNLGSIKDYTLSPTSMTDSNILTVQANTLIYYPRLFMTMYSLTIDLCLLKISCLCEFDESSVLLLFSSSYVTIVYLTRTFSNSIETILFSILVYLVIKSIKTQKILNERFLIESVDGATKSVISSNSNEFQVNKLSPKAKNSSFKRLKYFGIFKWNYLSEWIGVCLCLGVFNRPTFLIFAFIPILFWIQTGLNSCTLRQFLLYSFKRTLSIGKFFIPLSFLFSFIDTLYFYKIKSLDESLYLLKSLKFILTPYNFFLYNSNNEKLKEHGEHSIFQHFVNCFLLFGFNFLILIIIKIHFFYQFLFLSQENSFKNRKNSNLKEKCLCLMKKLMFFYKKVIDNLFCFFSLSFLVPLIIFSLVSHKEPRFLIPLVIPMCLLSSHVIFGKSSSISLRHLWYTFNFVLLIVFGYLHQGGVLASLSYVQKMFTNVSSVDQNYHVIYYHTYMPPRHLIQAPFKTQLINNNRYKLELVKNGKKIVEPIREIHDLMSSSTKKSLEQLIIKLKSENLKNLGIFLVAPSILKKELLINDHDNIRNTNESILSYNLIHDFKFHISFEHLLDHFNYLRCKFEENVALSKESRVKFSIFINKCRNMGFIDRFMNSFSLSLFQIVG